MIERIRAAVAEEPLIVTGNFYAGRSFGQSNPSSGFFYLRLPPLQGSTAVRRRPQRQLGE